jgi:hypothetical protein
MFSSEKIAYFPKIMVNKKKYRVIKIINLGELV